MPLSLDAPVSGELVLAHWPATRRAGTKPFYIEGLNVESGDWEQPAADQRYSELQAGVQLANRSGALNEIEYSEFVHKLQAFAEAVGAMPDFPDMLDVVARGRELDGFAGPLDAQLTLRLVARTRRLVGRLCAAMRRAPGPGAAAPCRGGWCCRPPRRARRRCWCWSSTRRRRWPTTRRPRRCAKSCSAWTCRRRRPTPRPFPAWHKVAHALAEDMDADVLDDAGRPITLHAFDAIGKDLAQLYAALESHDLAAGSPAARRLFS